MKILYTAEGVVEGGRAGQGGTSDGRLAVELSVPKELECVTCRSRGPHAPSPRALPLLERHARQHRRHAPRRRHTVK